MEAGYQQRGLAIRCAQCGLQLPPHWWLTLPDCRSFGSAQADAHPGLVFDHLHRNEV